MPSPAADTRLKEAAKPLKRTQDAIAASVRMEADNRAAKTLRLGQMKFIFLLCALLFVSLLGNCFGLYALWNLHPRYFATQDGQIIPIVALNEPVVSNSSLATFARDTTIQSFTLSFLNWRAELQAVSDRYTPAGFKGLTDALAQSGVLKTIQEKRMNMSIAADAAVISEEGVAGGVRQAVVQIPIRIQLVGQSESLPNQHFLATVRVVRVPVGVNPRGIAISQIVTKPN